MTDVTEVNAAGCTCLVMPGPFILHTDACDRRPRPFERPAPPEPPAPPRPIGKRGDLVTRGWVVDELEGFKAILLRAVEAKGATIAAGLNTHTAVLERQLSEAADAESEFRIAQIDRVAGELRRYVDDQMEQWADAVVDHIEERRLARRIRRAIAEAYARSVHPLLAELALVSPVLEGEDAAPATVQRGIPSDHVRTGADVDERARPDLPGQVASPPETAP